MNQFAKLVRFVGDVRAEAGRVTWPSGAETRKLTIMVFILATIVALFLVMVDMLIGLGLSALFGLQF